jgi:hypothetical protein
MLLSRDISVFCVHFMLLSRDKSMFCVHFMLPVRQIDFVSQSTGLFF